MCCFVASSSGLPQPSPTSRPGLLLFTVTLSLRFLFVHTCMYVCMCVCVCVCVCVYFDALHIKIKFYKFSSFTILNLLFEHLSTR